MRAQPDPVPALPELGLLERAINYTRVALSSVPAVNPHAPTPCAGWDLTDLLIHMDESLRTIEQAGRLETLDLAREETIPHHTSPPPRTPVDLLTAIQDRACALLDAWTERDGERLISIAGSPIQAGVLAAAGALEIAVHGVDLARACGVDHPLPDSLAADLRAYLPLLVQDSDRPTRFAPALPAPERAPARTRLLADLGRQS